jgi:hypothetical protein
MYNHECYTTEDEIASYDSLSRPIVRERLKGPFCFRDIVCTYMQPCTASEASFIELFLFEVRQHEKGWGRLNISAGLNGSFLLLDSGRNI